MRRAGALAVLLGLVVVGVACSEETVEVAETGAPVTSGPSTTTPSIVTTTTPMPPVTLPADATWRVYTTADGLGRDDVRFVDVAPDGTTWVLPGIPWGSDRVPHRFEDDAFSPYPAGCRIDPGGYQPLVAALGGTAYAACQEIAGGVTLRRFDGQRWEPVDLPPGEPIVSDLDIAPDGRLWMLASDAVWAHDGTWERVVVTQDRFGPIGVGPHGELWMQLDDAVARLDGDEWTDFPHERIEVPFWDEILVVGLDGTVWFLAADDGIAWLRLADGAWSELPVDLDLVAERIDAACVEARGVDPTLYDQPAELLDVASGATVGAGVAPDGALWTAVTCVGVGRFDPETGQARQYTIADGLPSLEFEDLAVAVDGSVWVTGPWGVAHLG